MSRRSQPTHQQTSRRPYPTAHVHTTTAVRARRGQAKFWSVLAESQTFIRRSIGIAVSVRSAHPVCPASAWPGRRARDSASPSATELLWRVDARDADPGGLVVEPCRAGRAAGLPNLITLSRSLAGGSGRPGNISQTVPGALLAFSGHGGGVLPVDAVDDQVGVQRIVAVQPGPAGGGQDRCGRRVSIHLSWNRRYTESRSAVRELVGRRSSNLTLYRGMAYRRALVVPIDLREPSGSRRPAQPCRRRTA